MKKVHCQTDVGIVQTFLRLTENNWRNSMYIECRVCKFPRSPVCANCADFLCIPGEHGEPVMLPVQEADIIFHRLIDKSECLLVISNVVFRDLYSNYFRRVANKSGECPFLQALKHEKKCLSLIFCLPTPGPCLLFGSLALRPVTIFAAPQARKRMMAV